MADSPTIGTIAPSMLAGNASLPLSSGEHLTSSSASSSQTESTFDDTAILSKEWLSVCDLLQAENEKLDQWSDLDTSNPFSVGEPVILRGSDPSTVSHQNSSVGKAMDLMSDSSGRHGVLWASQEIDSFLMEKNHARDFEPRDQPLQDGGQQLFRLHSLPESSSTEYPSSLEEASGEAVAKRKRIERARKAARARHSSFKTTEPKGAQERATTAAEHKGGVASQRLIERREMNKLAAAKCRAKAKSKNDDLRVLYEREAARHRNLKTQFLELRSALTRLRECSLQHHSSTCRCDFIHQYNEKQAQVFACEVENLHSPLDERFSLVNCPSIQAGEHF